MNVVSVFELRKDDIPAPAIDPTYATLDVSQEVQIGRPFSLENLARFRVDDSDAKSIVDVLKRAARVSSQYREYTKMLSRFGPSTRCFQDASLDWVMDILRPTLECQKSSAVILCGSQGIGKSSLSYHVYKSLLLQRRPSESIVTYFAFDTQDHRRLSALSMLSNITHQRLANEPDLFLRTTEPSQKDDLGWTEGHMWVQLRSIVRRVKSKTLVLIVDSVHDCNTHDLDEFLRSLFNLQFSRPEGFKLLCTTGIELSIEPATTFTIDSLDGFRHDRKVFITRQVDDIISENPKFEAVKDEVLGCLMKSEGFLHSSLLAHRIRTITSLSQPSRIRDELSLFGVNLIDTILEMVKESPPWVVSAVSWMLFARRPLRPLELAVAVILREAPLESSSPQIFDPDRIPRDIAGDLKRQLGPLVHVEDEKISISSPRARKIIQRWANSTPDDAWPSRRTLARLCLQYLHLCLKYGVENGMTMPNEIGFQLSGYVRDNWYIHYWEEMHGSTQPAPSNTKDDSGLEKLVYSLFTTPGYLSWLRPLNLLTTRAPLVDDTVPSPAYLATQFGLVDVVKRMLPDSNANELTILQIACRYGHLEIVDHLIKGIKDSAKIEIELDRACLRGDTEVFNVLLERRKTLPPHTAVSHHIIVNACRLGHKVIANNLLEAGADITGTNGSLLLEQAVDEGHLDVVELLLQKGVDVNGLLSDKSSPLHSLQWMASGMTLMRMA